MPPQIGHAPHGCSIVAARARPVYPVLPPGGTGPQPAGRPRGRPGSGLCWRRCAAEHQESRV